MNYLANPILRIAKSKSHFDADDVSHGRSRKIAIAK